MRCWKSTGYKLLALIYFDLFFNYGSSGDFVVYIGTLIENTGMTRMFCVKSSHNEKYEFVKGPRRINLRVVHMKLISRHLNTKPDRVINYEWNNNSDFRFNSRLVFGVVLQKALCPTMNL